MPPRFVSALCLTLWPLAWAAAAQDTDTAAPPPQETRKSCWNPLAGQPTPIPDWGRPAPARPAVTQSGEPAPLPPADALQASGETASSPSATPAPEPSPGVQASWYARHFQGRKTASGELYNREAWSAAHREWPMPSWVEVSTPDAQRKVMVRVNDRGPFHRGRTIDLSEAAAQAIGLVQSPGMLVRLRPVALEEVWAQLCPNEPPEEAAWPAWARQAELQHSYTPYARGFWLQWGLLKNRQATELLWQKLLRDQPELRPFLAIYHDRQGLRLQAGPFPSAAFALGMSPPHEAPQKLVERR